MRAAAQAIIKAVLRADVLTRQRDLSRFPATHPCCVFHPSSPCSIRDFLSNIPNPWHPSWCNPFSVRRCGQNPYSFALSFTFLHVPCKRSLLARWPYPCCRPCCCHPDWPIRMPLKSFYVRPLCFLHLPDRHCPRRRRVSHWLPCFNFRWASMNCQCVSGRLCGAAPWADGRSGDCFIGSGRPGTIA